MSSRHLLLFLASHCSGMATSMQRACLCNVSNGRNWRVHCLQVAMNQSFRPGDLVRARVLAMGTMREYRLTTAEAELGVVFARSLAGASPRLHAVQCL